jgi:hypothetical protein
LREVERQMERNAMVHLGRGSAARAGRQEPAARTAECPRTGNTGALPTGIVTGGPKIP